MWFLLVKTVLHRREHDKHFSSKRECTTLLAQVIFSSKETFVDYIWVPLIHKLLMTKWKYNFWIHIICKIYSRLYNAAEIDLRSPFQIFRKKLIYHSNMFLWIIDLSSKLIYIFRDLVEKDVPVNVTLFEYLNTMIVLTWKKRMEIC